MTLDLYQWRLWFPVAIGAGVLTYFSLSQEPHPRVLLTISALTLSVFIISFFLRQKHNLYLICLMLFWALLGFSCGGWRSFIINTTVLTAELGPVMAHGTIEEIEDRGTKKRILLSQVDLWQIPLRDTPEKIRITASRLDEALQPGDKIAVRVVIRTPPRPVFPGGYDFAKMIYFSRLVQWVMR